MNVEIRDYFETCSPENRGRYRTDISIPFKNINSKKYKNLFSDAFSHHTNDDFFPKKRKEISLNEEASQRFVPADYLLDSFLLKHYKFPEIREGTNDDSITFDFNVFRNRVEGGGGKGDSFTYTDESGRSSGTNTTIILIGEVDEGKTTCLCYLMREIALEHYEEMFRRKKLSEEELMKEELTTSVKIPIYISIESILMSNKSADDITEPQEERSCAAIVADSLSAKIGTAISHYEDYLSPENYRQLSLELDDHRRKYGTAGTNDQKIELLKEIIHQISTYGISFIVILDNLDRFYYKYEKVSFYDQGLKKLSDSGRLYRDLLFMFTDAHRLGNLGIATIFAFRRNVYEWCGAFNKGDKDDNFTGSIFRIVPTSEKEIISTRLKLFHHAASYIEQNGKIDNSLKAISRIANLFGIKEFANTVPKATQQRDERDQAGKEIEHNYQVLNDINGLCKYRNRSLVNFFCNLSLDIQEDYGVMERLFHDKPANLLLLFIYNLKAKYSSRENGFPNIFLNNITMRHCNSYSRLAEDECCHTYWMKFLALKYIESKKGECRADYLIKDFTEKGKYEKDFVLAMLGDLASSEDYACIEHVIDVNHARVSLTKRGKALISPTKQEGSSAFCFSFNYLQAIVDDDEMYYPNADREGCPDADRIFDPKQISRIWCLTPARTTERLENTLRLSTGMPCVFCAYCGILLRLSGNTGSPYSTFCGIRGRWIWISMPFFPLSTSKCIELSAATTRRRLPSMKSSTAA